MATEEEPSTEDDTQADITDPDDIDALLDSMEIDDESSTADDTQADITDPDDIDALLDSMATEEAPSTEDDTQADITDPDDIDALLDSMATEEELPTEDDVQADITDPDDIDALLDSMATEEEPSTDEEAQAEISDPEDVDALLASMDVDIFDNDIGEEKIEDKANVEESPNKAKIESLTEEYVAPLLAADFSDINETSIEADAAQESLVGDDFDIDSLLADVESNPSEQNGPKEIELDIGDDLAEGAFDEETLAELLSDKEEDYAVELTPDFSDQNVLADLLNDNEDSSQQVAEATEINDIQELDSLDFDELLANIEEESSAAGKSVDFNENLDVGDDISLADFDNISSDILPYDNNENLENEKDFVSVDALLSESQDEISHNEPYDKANIDVGLNEFPEFTKDVNQVDVDIDENGMAAKLELAKVYIEIGDQDNAHAILQEVVKQGDAQQQISAQEMLDDL